jgi:glycosyltransferase involved in cell wall biosynthesis
MRIAMIGSRGIGSNYGGIERVLDYLCPELALLGHQIDVFSRLDVPDTPASGIGVIRIPSVGGKRFENLSRSMISVAKALGRYDVVHLHAIGPGVLSLATRLTGQPSVVTVHGLDHRRDKWSPIARQCLMQAERTLVRHAGAISVVSEDLRRYFRARHDLSTTLIPNTVSPPTRQPAGTLLKGLGLTPGRYLLFASRLTPEKGCHDLVRAFNGLETDIRLAVVGRCGERGYLEGLQAEADPRKVVFCGHRQGAELQELFTHASLFALPSYVEGMSMALLEALSYGIPSLISDIPENRAVVSDPDAFFPIRDPDSLRHKLQAFIDHPGPRETLRLRQEQVKRPSWGEVAENYGRLYDSLLRKQRALPSAAMRQMIS